MMSSPDPQRLMVGRERAAAIAGLSRAQVDHWADCGLVSPSAGTRLTPHRRTALYSFLDLMSLMTAAALRKRGVSLQQIRRVVEDLRARGHNEPLRTLRWGVHAGQLHYQFEDGQWEGSSDPRQGVLREVIPLDELGRQIIERAGRQQQDVGRIERRRGVLGSKPVIAGTRVPVETITRYLQAGRSTEQVLESFPALAAEDVDAVRASIAV